MLTPLLPISRRTSNVYVTCTAFQPGLPNSRWSLTMPARPSGTSLMRQHRAASSLRLVRCSMTCLMWRSMLGLRFRRMKHSRRRICLIRREILPLWEICGRLCEAIRRDADVLSQALGFVHGNRWFRGLIMYIKIPSLGNAIVKSGSVLAGKLVPTYGSWIASRLYEFTDFTSKHPRHEQKFMHAEIVMR